MTSKTQNKQIVRHYGVTAPYPSGRTLLAYIAGIVAPDRIVGDFIDLHLAERSAGGYIALIGVRCDESDDIGWQIAFAMVIGVCRCLINRAAVCGRQAGGCLCIGGETAGIADHACYSIGIRLVSHLVHDHGGDGQVTLITGWSMAFQRYNPGEQMEFI